MVVVEDGRGDLDERSLEGARLLRLDHVGRSRARNAGVEAARTPYVAFLDEDDLALPGRLERQIAALEAAPDAALSFGRVRVVDGEGRAQQSWNRILDRRFRRLCEREARFEELLASQCPIYTSATMVRRESFQATGGYDPLFDAYEDLDLYLRLSRRGRLVACPGEALAVYRLHGQNTPSERLYRGALAVVDKHLPEAEGRARRLLLERRVDALWGLGEWHAARREALRATFIEPVLLTHPRFLRRLLVSVLPAAVRRAG